MYLKHNTLRSGTQLVPAFTLNSSKSTAINNNYLHYN